jgi:hypothetical protein
VVLAVAAGWALERFAGVRDAMLLGLVAGLLIAQFVPMAGRGAGAPGDGGC